MLLMIDNYDSFTYNVVQYLGELGADVCVYRNDEITLEQVEQLNPERIVVSPGPCTPNEAGISVSLIKRFASIKPILGICLGLQLLFEQSIEFGTVEGLGILPGKVMRFHFPDDPTLKVPHMGWNTLTLNKPSPLFDSMEAHPYYYFVHSYYVVPDNPDMVATTTQYGVEFVSGIQHENIHAFQFHPEKSQKQGLTMLEKFARLN